MRARTRWMAMGAGLIVALAGAAASATDARNDRAADSAASALFLQENPQAGLYRETSGRISSVYGAAFASGPTSVDAAQWFVTRHSELFGVPAGDLRQVNLLTDQQPTLQLMFDPATGTYKHTLVYFSQYKDGVPVYRADLRVLVRNEPGNPVVLAKSALKHLGDFAVPADYQAKLITQAQVHDAVRGRAPGMANFSNPELFVWAGVDEMQVAPALALILTADNGQDGTATMDRRLFVVDALSAKVLYTESLIHNVDVVGSVRGMATTGVGADICGAEVSTALPYAQVSIGATQAYADAAGNFTIPNGGSGPVTVNSDMIGRYFHVFNTGGATELLSQSVTPPGPANFVHNAANTDERVRAQVNAYIHANVVRDFTLQFNPSYPVISTQTDFTVNVNLGSTCNAFYDGPSINFYLAGGGCANTAFSVVVHHEYGHHLVASAGSGQGAYGEGFGDVMGVLITDTSQLAIGFQNNCSNGIRDANNSCQYQTTGCSSCGSEVHACGQLISGCVWSTRNYLFASDPINYRNILADIAVNSMPLHSGSSITPSITIDFLTLDDNDANIGNGTPHYTQINQGFTDHNMPGPALSLIDFEYPSGRPALLSPAGGVAFHVNVVPVSGAPVAGTGMLHYSTGAGFTAVPLVQTSANSYDAVFPAIPCGTAVSYYVSAQAVGGSTATSPPNAPTQSFSSTSATSSSVAFSDDVETNQGWQLGVAGDSASTGIWVRGDPIGTGAQPEDDHTPAPGVNCFFTGQGTSGGGVGQNDIDGGTTTLVSPTFDLSGATGSRVAYWRWYSNVGGAAPNADTFVIDISNNNGASWTNVEVVGPAGPETEGGWYFHEFVVDSFVAPTAQMRLRFVASDLGSGSVVEAAVDDFVVTTFGCTPPPACPADYNNDGSVTSQDFFDFLSAFFSGSADFNHDGTTNSQDFFDFIGAFFTPC
ncbi:MAG: GC-type dockerin domain-anchored protein [Phycisphaerales bacterium]